MWVHAKAIEERMDTSWFFESAVYGLRGRGLDGGIKTFEKPWASTALMFLGMALCLPLSLLLSAITKKRKKKQTFSEAVESAIAAHTPLLSDRSSSSAGPKQQTR